MEALDQHMEIIRKVSDFGRLALELLTQADECPHLAVRETTPPLALVSDSDICVAAQGDKAALPCHPLSAQRSISFLCHGCSPGLRQQAWLKPVKAELPEPTQRVSTSP